MGIILLSLLLRYCVSNVEGSCSSGNPGSCDECLSQSHRCAWCTQENFTNWFSAVERCDTPEALLEKGCPEERLEFHVSHAETLLDTPLGRRPGAANSTQVSPQRMALTLRPGSQITFQVRVQQTHDYPVDIYYLMDLSASMTDDLEMIMDLGSTLTREMRSLTSKFRLGFGSFVEKPVLPFIEITEEELANPCSNWHDSCLPTFGYKHVLSLTSNTGMFNHIISKQRVSANLDGPECGFDGIMQAAVCGDKIGWRNDSMRLLVFVSDADSHFGMDSRMGGIVVPNDGQCHLDDNNDYTMSAMLEYPTLGQLIDKLVENNILLIFAVTENQSKIYENYAKLIPGATVGVLASDSENVLELIITAYKELRSEIELEVLGDTEGLQMSFTSICPNGSVHQGLKRCSSIKAGDTVLFNVSVELTSCLPTPGSFLLKPVGFQDGLVVDLSSLCSCHCTSPGPQPNANTTSTTTSSTSTSTTITDSLCHKGQGIPECGVCMCRPGFVGSQCECSEEDALVGGSGDGCRATEDLGSESCSGRGECFCGRCVCHASSFGQIYGEFCECDNYSCVRFRGELCGGHGQCDCGRCVCDDGWLGEYCNCSISTEACVAPDGTPCSGRGRCECGQCVCSVAGASGQLCEKCPTCGDTCTSARPCVECHLLAKESLDLCVQRCSSPKIAVNTSAELDQRHAIQCALKTDSDCFVSFSIVMGELGTSAHDLQIDCPEPPNVTMIIVGVSLSILCMGLILLVVWKLLISAHDRKEVARFEAERSNAKWQSGTNPLFRSSTSTFKNVTYKNTGRDKVITLGRS